MPGSTAGWTRQQHITQNQNSLILSGFSTCIGLNTQQQQQSSLSPGLLYIRCCCCYLFFRTCFLTPYIYAQRVAKIRVPGCTKIFCNGLQYLILQPATGNLWFRYFGGLSDAIFSIILCPQSDSGTRVGCRGFDMEGLDDHAKIYPVGDSRSFPDVPNSRAPMVPGGRPHCRWTRPGPSRNLRRGQTIKSQNETLGSKPQRVRNPGTRRRP
jgi:hypothetical protein